MQAAGTLAESRVGEDVEVVDDFALDVVVVTDAGPGEVAAPCTTEDGCAPTCASSCVSAV